MSRCKINLQLFKVKMFYFFSYGARASLIPFIAIYMKHLGLSASEAAIINGTMLFVSVFARPLAGAVADKFRRYKLPLVILCVLSAICFQMILFVPSSIAKETIGWKRACADEFLITESKAIDSGAEKPLCAVPMVNIENVTIISVTCTALCPCRQTDREHCVVSQNATTANLSLEVQLVRNQTSTNKIHVDICNDYYINNMTNNYTILDNTTCDISSMFDCEIYCSFPVASEHNKEAYGMTFWLFLLIFFFANLFTSPISNLSDVIVYDMLGHKRHLWGQQRVWGSIGFGVVALLSTLIREFIVDANDSMNYSAAFYIFTALTLCAAAIGATMRDSAVMATSTMVRNVLKVFANAEIATIFIVIFFSGYMSSSIISFLFWYLEDLGTTQFNLGLCLSVNCISEIVMFPLAGRIMPRIGVVGCMHLMFLAYSIRFVGYSFLTNPWYALPLESLHGFTFGLFWAAATSYTKAISPPGTSATLQGLINSIYEGFGGGIGVLATGPMFESIGGTWTFRVYGIASGLLLVLYAIVQYACFKSRRRGKRQDKVLNGANESQQYKLKDISPVTDHLTADCQSNYPNMSSASDRMIPAVQSHITDRTSDGSIQHEDSLVTTTNLRAKLSDEPLLLNNT